MLVLGCSGLFKDYTPHKVQALSAANAEMDDPSLKRYCKSFMLNIQI